ncbi:molybdenum cofactor synthesis domain-containing protein [Aliiruegeria lutimaris]|uniref:Molybdopterin molybdenumtransferase n=1 Tax=Aliiruegeria lutimaris TaxID=571298 RepID=A0A1G9CXZ9_9RHOB|nr:molybdenum cofactor synthesis domain-containing protein [Aliiruegeria lutimaris]SDK56551.1 molybdopterin molybdotransferase [Aliiruegeria lutimaris]
MISPPKLRNDCFALPPGVDWIPMETALSTLRDRMTPVVGQRVLPVDQAAGMVLAAPAQAQRNNPPADNSAVDGFGFAGPVPDGPVEMALVEGRAAAGVPYGGNVPVGMAIRILTGAILPEGVDSVVLQEDVAREGERIAFNGPLKKGANRRLAGEDVRAGQPLLPAGHRLQPQDIGFLVASGISDVTVFERLRVGVLSNGDEVVSAGDSAPETLGPGAIFDANRPMLLAQLTQWGFEAVDLGCASDARDDLRGRLDRAATEVDAVLTSGGVSTGDEDHVSALLRDEGQITSWRIAIKPGRPLALGLWKGVPIFGLPGNPVAAFVCTLLFARPALEVLAGGQWRQPQGFDVPAAFEKRKKPGRAEFLRARIGSDGRVEAFSSEGSGRISGLSWSTGLVAFDEAERHVTPGDPVRFLPYAGF